MRYREHEILLWFRITTWVITCDAFVVQPSLQWPKINKAMGTIKGGRGNVTDLERKRSLGTKHLWVEELQWGIRKLLNSYVYSGTEKGSREETK